MLTFVDTNVLLYAHDASEKVKRPQAQAVLRRLWDERTGVLSTQILQEFYSVATGKMTPRMLPAEARELIAAYATWPVVRIDPALILNASRLHQDHQLSFWDALVVEAARTAGADILLTEDLSNGQTIAGVRVQDLFTGGSGR